MRAAKEGDAWSLLRKKHRSATPVDFEIGGSTINLAAACTVLSGRNGTGKSRLLRDIRSTLAGKSVLLDMHHLCEQALIVLRSRADLTEMADEFGSLGPDEERLDDIQRIVGRKYQSVEWYALEIELDDEGVAEEFRWAATVDPDAERACLIPYFRVEYRGLGYTSKDMGLGEFSVHFLFWILEQYRDAKDITILLDEPDAYLPPVGIEALLGRILHICATRNWRLVISTHSEEMIARAVEKQALTLLRVDREGQTVAVHAADNPAVALELLSRPPINQVLFCEDESACHLTRGLLDMHDLRMSRATMVLWGNGHGYLRELHKSLPKPPVRGDLGFAYVFDGDQRVQGVDVLENRWPVAFLPTDDDPDTLFKATAEKNLAELARRLGVSESSLELVIDSIETADAHDWVDKLGDRYGRQVALRTLAAMWVEDNDETAAAFAGDVTRAWR